MAFSACLLLTLTVVLATILPSFLTSFPFMYGNMGTLKSTSLPFQDLWHHTHFYLPLFSSKAHSSIGLSFYQDRHFHKSLEKQASSLYSVKALTSKISISRDSARMYLQLKKYPFKEPNVFFPAGPLHLSKIFP